MSDAHDAGCAFDPVLGYWLNVWSHCREPHEMDPRTKLSADA